MKLTKEDLGLYYKLHPALLFYTNRKGGIIGDVSTLKEFKALSKEEVFKAREGLWRKPALIDSFVKENPFDFSQEELEIVHGWKNSLRGNFYLLQYLKKYAIFLDWQKASKAYGVWALTSEFEEILGSYLPLMVQAVLMPFKGQIVYDGFLPRYPYTFGSGIRQSLFDAYREAKSRFGVITSLPFSAKEREVSDIQRLKFYLKTKGNREKYWEEIEDLINKDSYLMAFYHQEMGRVYARKYKRELQGIGLADAWFAILQGMIIASGTTREEVESISLKLLPPKKRDWVHIFHLPGR